MANSPEQDQALRTARALTDIGHSLDSILESPLIPINLKIWVRQQLEAEQNRTLRPANVISERPDVDWLAHLDRSQWHYWQTLRQFLLSIKGWSVPTLRSLDDSSDKILRQLAPPETESFDIRGLVLGYVQSGKTASFTSVIAKSADAGYRLIIVLSGIDNGLRRQTQLRLNRELVGYSDNRPNAVRLPPVGLQWHTFTTDEVNGDFRPGYANHAALQGSQPVLLVVKKNGAVLRRLLAWLREAPEEVKGRLPTLIVDDEADQASIDTRGSYQTEEDLETDEDLQYEAPSVINGLIRQILGLFNKRAYIAYTATPFANILIPHNAHNPDSGDDLYPRDFIIDLPKPEGYFGAEEFFGRLDPNSDEEIVGLDVVREVATEDIEFLREEDALPTSLATALHAFVLAGAGRAFRGDGSRASTMLIHTSHTIAEQNRLSVRVSELFGELRDEWRYQRNSGIRERLNELWSSDFVETTRLSHPQNCVDFEQIERFIGPFFESVQVREINSATGDTLDYDAEPDLKVIAIGGNRLARGLTLDGLLTSYFVRRTDMYDTLMQMGRWFGYRGGYEDLTRIYTTAELAGWFADLALVEYRLREDIQVYENQGIKPSEVGPRILTHPTMQVTNALKQRFAVGTTIEQSYSGTLEQTFKFPFNETQRMANLCEANQASAAAFVSSLGTPYESTLFGPLWQGIPAAAIIDFLGVYQVDSNISNIVPSLMASYINRLNLVGELVEWTVMIRGRQNESVLLGSASWMPDGLMAWNVSRTRLKHTNSMGVITNPGDEAFGLNAEENERREYLLTQGVRDQNRSARFARSVRRGLLLLYPISQRSEVEGRRDSRQPLYENSDHETSKEIVGLAISFPKSDRPQYVEAYLEGTVGWRSVDD